MGDFICSLCFKNLCVQSIEHLVHIEKNKVGVEGKKIDYKLTMRGKDKINILKGR